MEHGVCPDRLPPGGVVDRTGIGQQAGTPCLRPYRPMAGTDTDLGRRALFPVRVAHKIVACEPMIRCHHAAAAGGNRSRRGFRIAVLAAVGLAPVLLLPHPAFADAPKVTIPAGPLNNGQTITVSGSGFPGHAEDPPGLQIIESSDPQGSSANLPTDPSQGCEGITVNPSQINTDSAGRFQTSYLIAALSSSAGTSSIDCDATHECVLW